MRRSTCRHLLALLVLAVGIFYLATIRPGHDWGGDFALYIAHAMNIAEGRPYGQTGYIYNPHLPSLAPRTYPPVFPLLLAPVYRCFGLDLTAMKVEVILFFLLALVAIFLTLEEELPPQYALATAGLVGLNYYIWGFKDSVLSDLPFLCFTYLGLLLIRRAYALGRPPSRAGARALLLGAALYLAYGTRSIGLVLVASLVLFDLYVYRRPSRFALQAIAVFGGLALLQNLLVHSDRSYLDQMPLSLETARAIVANPPGYWEAVVSLCANGYSRGLAVGLAVAVTGLAAAGYLGRLLGKISILEVFAPLYLAGVLVWPTSQGTRFLIPVVPVLVFYALAGLRALVLRVPRAARRWAVVALLVVVCGSYLGAYTRLDYGPIREGVALPASVELFEWVRTATGRDDVFIFRKPMVLALYTGRRAAAYHRPAQDQALLDYFREIRVSYLVVSNTLYRDRVYLQGFVERNRGHFQEVYRNADFSVYRFAAG